MECFKPALSRGEHWPDKRVCIIRNDGNWIKCVMHFSDAFESELSRGKPNVAPTNVFVSFRISVTSDKSTRVVD